MANFVDKNGLNHFYLKLKNVFANKDIATQSQNGLMSASDKVALDGFKNIGTRVRISLQGNTLIITPINSGLGDNVDYVLDGNTLTIIKN